MINAGEVSLGRLAMVKLELQAVALVLQTVHPVVTLEDGDFVLGIFELELLALRLLCAIREQIAQGVDDLCIRGQLLL